MRGAYPPLNTLKPVGCALWCVDGPFVAHGGLPLPGRAAVARLADGSLWLHAPTQITRSLQDELAALGPVAHVFAPDPPHDAHVAAWRHFHPGARVWTARDLGADMPWSADIAHLTLQGSGGQCEVVFFHRPSETLIVSGLIASFETGLLPAWVRPVIWLTGTDAPRGGMPPRLRRAMRDRDALAESVQQMIDWQPRRLLLAHGAWYERDAVPALERIFRKVLRERLWVEAVEDMKQRQR